jgi:hypothetical protein
MQSQQVSLAWHLQTHDLHQFWRVAIAPNDPAGKSMGREAVGTFV